MNDLAMLCHQFSLILKSGIHPVECTLLLYEDTVNPKLKKALESLSNEVVHGSSCIWLRLQNASDLYDHHDKVGEHWLLEPAAEGLEVL